MRMLMRILSNDFASRYNGTEARFVTSCKNCDRAQAIIFFASFHVGAPTTRRTCSISLSLSLSLSLYVFCLSECSRFTASCAGSQEILPCCCSLSLSLSLSFAIVTFQKERSRKFLPDAGPTSIERQDLWTTRFMDNRNLRSRFCFNVCLFA